MMDTNKNSIDAFKEYADHELKNHQAELNTRYQNESVGSEELQKAYSDHKLIYSKELEQKAQELLENGNSDSAKKELQDLKEKYVSQFDQIKSS
jgi:hypothetical protein